MIRPKRIADFTVRYSGNAQAWKEFKIKQVTQKVSKEEFEIELETHKKTILPDMKIWQESYSLVLLWLLQFENLKMKEVNKILLLNLVKVQRKL